MNNYFDLYKEVSDKYLELNLNRLFQLEEILGTDCNLYKNRDDDPYKDMLGSSSTNIELRDPVKIRIIINKNMMNNPFNHQSDGTSVYTASKEPNLGDIISFRTRKEVVYYKVEALEEYSIDSGKVKRLVLSGYRNSG